MIIYKFTNKVNGKHYIGLTTRGFEVRIKEHMYQHLNPNTGSYNSVFYRALRKHGWDNFSCEIIDHASSKDELMSKESYWISYYKSFSNDNGYNSTTGGDLHEFREESRLKMATSHGGKPFLVFDTSGNFVSRYEIHSEFAKELGVSMKHIATALRAKYYSLGGYIPIYEEDYSDILLENRIKLISVNRRTGERNVQSKLTADIVSDIKIMLINNLTHSHIARQFNVDRSCIGSIANNKTWKYVVVDGWDDYLANKKRVSGSRIATSKMTEGEVIEIKRKLMNGVSRKEISNAYGLSYNGVTHIDTGKTWKHVNVDGWSDYISSKKVVKTG